MAYERLDEALRQLKIDRERAEAKAPADYPPALCPSSLDDIVVEDGDIFGGEVNVAAARARKSRFAIKPPAEGDGFELLVPRHKSRGFPQHSGHCGGIGGLLNDTT